MNEEGERIREAYALVTGALNYLQKEEQFARARLEARGSLEDLNEWYDVMCARLVLLVACPWLRRAHDPGAEDR